MGGGDDYDDREEPKSGADEDGVVVVHIRCSNGSKFTVRGGLGSTVSTFKSVVAQSCDIPADQQRLIYKGRILKDDQTLESYGVQADHTVHLVRGFASSAVNDSANATTDNNASNNSTQHSARAVASVDDGGFGGLGLGGLLFPGVGANGLGGNGMSGLFGTGIPELEQVQQQITQNPNIMREIMNMPSIQNLLNDPDLMRNLITSNPQMREIIDRNPELAHILNDPGILRQTLEAVRNPEMMREMMRNTDRAMSNIEASPEGFNMLRRMYETVREPFLNATTTARDDGASNGGSNPFVALLGNLGGGQTRDRSSNASTTGTETVGTPAPNTNPLPNPWTPGGVQNNNGTIRMPSATGGGRTPGTGGLGLPELGGLPDPSRLAQMMQNPLVTQMMQNLLSNPQYVNQILGLNPQLRNLMESNPQFREMLQSREFLRQVTSPETLQQLMSFQQTLSGQLNRQQNNQKLQTCLCQYQITTVICLVRQQGTGSGSAGTGTPKIRTWIC